MSHPQRVATLSQLPSGLYRRGLIYYGSYPDPRTGKRLRRSLGSDLRAALARLLELRGPTDPLPHTPPKRDRVLIADVLRAYLERLAVYSKPSVVKQTRSTVDRLTVHLGSVVASSLSGKHLQRFISARRVEGVRDVTINGDLSTLRTALNRAVEDRRLATLPVRVVFLRATKRRTPHLLSADDARALLESARRLHKGGERAYGVLLVSLSTGFRIAETLHLTWGDVDFAAHRINVRSKPGMWTTKTYAERSVFVAPAAMDYLRSLRESRCDETSEGWIFATRTGTPMSVGNADRVLRTVFKRAGLYRRGAGTSHRIRHTVASTMLANGVDLRTTQDVLGHANIATTSLYLHVVDERKREAANRIGLV